LLFSHISPTFLHYADTLYDPYLSYLKNYDDAADLLAQLRNKNKAFRFFLEWAEASDDLDLESFLIMPLQRLPRYNLLFTELVKDSTSSSPGHADVLECKNKMLQLTSRINLALKQKRNIEKLTEMCDIFDNLSIILPAPDRVLIKQGMVRRRDRKAKGLLRKNLKEFNLFLFTDILIYGRVRGRGRFTFKRSFPLWSVEVSKVDGETDVSTKSSATANDLRLKIPGTDDLAFAIDSAVELSEWISALNKAIATAKTLPHPDSFSLQTTKPQHNKKKSSSHSVSSTTPVIASSSSSLSDENV